MSGGSARPKRPKAAPAGLRYAHLPGRPGGGKPKKDRGWMLGCLLFPLGFLAVILPVAAVAMTWGYDIWGDLAVSWPGGPYAFAGSVGAVAPLVFVAFAAPLARMEWKRSRIRSLGRAAASLPGLAVGYLVAGVIFSVVPSKHGFSGCGSRGSPCWVQQNYPYVWIVGLLATVVMTAALIAVLIKYGPGRSTSPSTSEP
ncbi:hypothetical protein ACYF6T_38165 [Streptomyces sp. 7R007]